MTAEIKPRIDFEGRTPLQDVIPLSTPYLVFLDPSDICNQKCPFCPSGDVKLLKSVGRFPQLMDYDLYKKIINDLCKMPQPIKTLRLYKDGEPLLNPRFPDMVSYAKGTGRFLSVDTTTNGMLLTHFLVKDIVLAGIDRVVVSVPTHMISDILYIEGVRSLYEQGRGICKVYVKIIGDGLTTFEKDAFMSNFQEISDRIFIENLAPCWPGYQVQAHDVGIYGQPVKEVQVCPYIFYSISINSNGTVSKCFLDWTHQYLIGNLKDSTMNQLWDSPIMNWYRKEQLRRGRKWLTSCGSCGQMTHGAPDDIDQYADELLKRFEGGRNEQD